MEYRGYDSAGIAVWTEEGLLWRKKAGKLSNLEAELAQHPVAAAHLGIGHTRWATHGAPTDVNAHPHLSADGRVALIHNGIIENFASLRAELESAGVAFASQTDSEVAAQLIARELGTGAGLEGSSVAVSVMMRNDPSTLLPSPSAARESAVGSRRMRPVISCRQKNTSMISTATPKRML